MGEITGLVASFLSRAPKRDDRLGSDAPSRILGERGAQVMRQGIDETKIPRIEGPNYEDIAEHNRVESANAIGWLTRTVVRRSD